MCVYLHLCICARVYLQPRYLKQGIEAPEFTGQRSISAVRSYETQTNLRPRLCLTTSNEV